jgi:hypothetical protein
MTWQPTRATEFRRTLSDETRVGYDQHFGQVARWCASQSERLEPTSTDGLILYVVAHERQSPNTLANAVHAVNRVCHEGGLPIAGHHWKVRAIMKALRRGAQEHRAYPLDAETEGRMQESLLHSQHLAAAALRARERAALLVSRRCQIPLPVLTHCQLSKAGVTDAGAVLEVRRTSNAGVAPAQCDAVVVPRTGDDLDPVVAIQELASTSPPDRPLLWGLLRDQTPGHVTRAIEDPDVVTWLIRRRLDSAAQRCGHARMPLEPFVSAGMTDDQVREILEEIDPDRLRRCRDAAIISLPLRAGALRPVALTTIRVERVRERPAGGYEVWVGPHKTERAGFWVTVLHSPGCGLDCPACRLRDLLGALRRRGIVNGPLLARVPGATWSGEVMKLPAISQVFSRVARAAGLSLLGISGRSGRRGALTAMDRAGYSEEQRMRLGRHRSATVARRYITGGGSV